jgi:hypothetical protein
MRPSSLQFQILQALVDAGGSMQVTALVRRHAGSVAVARASTSRTLRRLWHTGHVELHDKRGGSLTAMKARGMNGAYITSVTLTPSGVTAIHRAMEVNGSGTDARGMGMSAHIPVAAPQRPECIQPHRWYAPTAQTTAASPLEGCTSTCVEQRRHDQDAGHRAPQGSEAT